jgi:hypothetical protein
MHIVHIVVGKVNPDSLNGVSKVVHWMATAQTELGHDVEVWGLVKSTTPSRLARSFNLRLFPMTRLRFILGRELRAAIEALETGAWVQFHSVFCLEFPAIARRLRRRGIAYGVTPHGGYRTPPDWMQCIFQLRLVALILTGLVFVTLLVAPEMVMRVTAGVGIRLSGGTIGPVGYLCPLIAIVSAFAWLERLESRVRAGFYFGIGVAGTFLAQSRGFEICLLLILAVLVVGRARKRRSAAQMLIAASLAAVLLLSFLLTVVNGEQIWSTLNHGQSAAEIASASGRTDVWKELIAYCLSHPQGLGYIAGMRHSTLGAAGPSLHASLHALGGTDNAYMEVLADAGWLALGLYLMWLGKIAMLGVRTLKYAGQHRGRYGRSHAAGPSLALATRCTLLLLLFCGIEGMESSEYVIPMMVPFYLQNTLIAILLGLWTSVVLAERRRVI